MLTHVTGVQQPEKLLEMRERYRQHCREEMPERTTFYPGVPEGLAELHRQGRAIALLSLKLRDLLVASLVKYQLDPYFRLVRGIEDVPAPKPDPSGLLAIVI